MDDILSDDSGEREIKGEGDLGNGIWEGEVKKLIFIFFLKEYILLLLRDREGDKF